MRVLTLSRVFPTDPEQAVHGVFRRFGMFVDAIRLLGHELDMLFYVPPSVQITEAYRASMAKALSHYWDWPVNLFLAHTRLRGETGFWGYYGAGAINFLEQAEFRSVSGAEQVREFEQCLDRKPDWIFAHKLHAMCPILRTRRLRVPVLLDLDDIEHVAFRRSISQPPTWTSKRLLYLQIPALIHGERCAMRLAERTFVCSTEDKVHLETRLGAKGVVVVPNSVETPRMPEEAGSHPTVLFLGAYSYPPNATAADFLVTTIWPLISAAIPEAELLIAGRMPERIPSYRNPPVGVRFLGFANDLDALYARTHVVCCPIFAGGGTRVKIIEAALYGKPVVSSRVGAEGLKFENEQEIVIRDSAQAMAESCIQLLKDRGRRRLLGTAARAAAMRHYDRDAIVDSLRREITSIIERNGERAVPIAA